MDEESLKNLLCRSDLTQSEKLLLCLSMEPNSPKTVKEIKDIAKSAGLNEIEKWNVSDAVARAKGLTVRLDSGWELTRRGQERAHEIASKYFERPIQQTSPTLRSHAEKLADAQVQAFVEEAIVCFETGQYRAAVLLSWVGAIALLQDFVVQNHLKDFNHEAERRNSKWKKAKTRDDISLMKEKEFLDILSSLSVVGKNTKQELESCLTLRNGCGHPNSLEIAEHRAASHIEILILNVFSKF